MTWLDVLLLAALAVYAIAGYRRGFIVGGLGFAGFVGGGALGMLVVPLLIGDRPLAAGAAAVALVSVLACATIGGALGSWVGSVVRSRVSWHPARRLDAVAGALLSAVAMLLVVWFLAGIALTIPRRRPSFARPMLFFGLPLLAAAAAWLAVYKPGN